MAVDLQESGSKLRRSRSFETLCPNVSSVCELEFTVAIWLLITAQLRLFDGVCASFVVVGYVPYLPPASALLQPVEWNDFYVLCYQL